MAYKRHDFSAILLGNKTTEEKIKELVTILTSLDIELRSQLDNAHYRTLGPTNDATEGNIRYQSGRFEGYDGSKWNYLDN